MSELNAIEWNNYHNIYSVDEKSDFIFKNLEVIVDKLISEKQITVKNSIKWYNSELNDLKLKRNEKHATWVKAKSSDTWNEYKVARNIYKNALQSAERNYLTNQLNTNRNDPKKLWRIFKSCYSDNNNESLEVIKFCDDVVESRGEIICEKLNSYFVQSIEDIANNIPQPLCDICISNEYVTSSFKFNEISERELRLFVSDSKNKSFLNNINGRVLNDAMCNREFSTAFLDLINSSLNLGVFPNNFKSSIIVPIQKVKKTIKCDELRPINRLKVEESILERVVKMQVVNYFEENKLFMPEQSGFRKKHSCETALNRVVHDWKIALDSKKIVIAVFLDLKRAFETIDRSFLIKKMETYGFHNIVVWWFNSFLSDRIQFTKFNEFLSSGIINLIGIPQGSVLSCILFIIFINDIKLVIKHCTINFFADDGLIQITCDNIHDGLNKINSDLTNIFDYLCKSRLSLNISKTKFMIVSNRRIAGLPEVKINNQPLERVSEFKYLGVVLDESLSLNPFTDDLCKKLNKKFAIFKRCEKKLTYFSKLTYYTSLTQPHIDTSGSILYMLNQSQISRVQLIQNRFMRTILRADARTSITSMLETLKWLSVKQRVIWNTLKFIHKVKNNQAPEYLQELLITVADSHNINTRQRENFYIPRSKLVSTNRSIFRDGLKLYDEACAAFRRENDETTRRQGFFNYLKTYARNFF